MLKLENGIVVHARDVTFRFSRSSGPGGQNVNKIDSKVTLLLDIRECSGIDPQQKMRLMARLGKRLTREGMLKVVCQKHRTQAANRVAAVERLGEILEGALEERAVRKATAIPYAAHQKRLRRKRKRSELKQARRMSRSGLDEA